MYATLESVRGESTVDNIEWGQLIVAVSPDGTQTKYVRIVYSPRPSSYYSPKDLMRDIRSGQAVAVDKTHLHREGDVLFAFKGRVEARLLEDIVIVPVTANGHPNSRQS